MSDMKITSDNPDKDSSLHVYFEPSIFGDSCIKVFLRHDKEDHGFKLSPNEAMKLSKLLKLVAGQAALATIGITADSED